ncbi:MAG: methyltransferase domain-containing protein [bacterium]|nr:methyltransferase domain-containing protein [bacterium]
MKSHKDIIAHYENRYDEDTRLSRDGLGQLELLRTQILVKRYLPQPPGRVLDVGGGPGVYAYWLTAAGYEVELIDIVQRHVDQATQRGITSHLGDARKLPATNQRYDTVLMLGPLYHLQKRKHRLTALQEAVRVAKPGAPVFAAAISRYAPAIDGLAAGFWDDPEFAEIVIDDLEHGKHNNPTGDPQYFTTSYFHRPEDLFADMTGAGLVDVEVLPVEGIAWSAADLDERMVDEEKQDALLELLERLEDEPSILGASPHLLGVGRTPH